MTKATTNQQWNQMLENHELAHLRADICLGSPQSYSLDEMKTICDDIDASAAEIDAALRADFEALPPEFQGKLLDMLCASGVMTEEWWKETLLGKMPDSPDELMA